MGFCSSSLYTRFARIARSVVTEDAGTLSIFRFDSFQLDRVQCHLAQANGQCRLHSQLMVSSMGPFCIEIVSNFSSVPM